MSRHTPGPWEMVHRDDQSFMSMTVIAQKGRMGNTANVCRLFDDPNAEDVIAVVYHQLDPLAGQGCEIEEAFGNAKLISLAPKLLDALRELAASMDGCESREVDNAKAIIDEFYNYSMSGA